MVLDSGNEVNILIIGNGLDISLGYPTKYADFLNFCEDFIEKFGFSQDCLDQLWNSEINKKSNHTKAHINHEDILENLKKLQDSLQECIKENWWIDYFRKRYRDKRIRGENWIDIENEVKIVINKLETKIDSREMFENIQVYNECIRTSLIDILRNIDNKVQITFVSDNYEKIRAMFIERLRNDYDKFIAALGIYLNFFAFSKEIDTPNVLQLTRLADKIQYVLCFNYRDNYLVNYIEEDCAIDCMVHGHLRGNLDEGADFLQNNDMVVGFQDKREDEASLVFEYYRKYFQRIVKGTGNAYLSWFNDAELAGKRINVYIFGHSLDPTDEEILKPLFFFKKVHFTVYYRADDDGRNTDLEAKVTNLVRILGKDNLVRFTSGVDPIIKFEKQIELKKKN